jgi:hypothetical protein
MLLEMSRAKRLRFPAVVPRAAHAPELDRRLNDQLLDFANPHPDVTAKSSGNMGRAALGVHSFRTTIFPNQADAFFRRASP